MAWIKAALCATIFLFCHGAVAQEPAEASGEAAPLQEQGLEAPSSVGDGSAEVEAPGSEPVDALEDASLAAAAQDEAEGRDYDTFIKGVVLAITERFDVAGVSAAVVENGEVASLYAWGYADAERTKPITSDGSLMRLASVSKTFTWTALAQLVHEGKIDLDKDVNAYLTEIEVPEAFGVPVTLRDIIAHQAGFEDQGLGLRPTRTDVSLVEQLSKQVPRRMRAPGTAVSYSNWATGLAGRIIENVEGKPFNDVIKERIFEPTGMARSTFRHELPGELAPLMPESAVRENGQWLSGGMPVIFGEEAAGSLRATGADMAKYMIMHLNEGEIDGRQVLSPGVAEGMREPTHRLAPGMPAMLFGWYEIPTQGTFAYGHGGFLPSFGSRVVLLPELELGLYVTVIGEDAWPLGGMVQDAFLDWVIPAPKGPRPTVEPGRDYAPFVGHYRNLRRNFSRIERADQLDPNSMGELIIAEHPDGGLSVIKDSGSQRYVPLEGRERVFVSVDDRDDLLGFSGSGDEVAEFFQFSFPVYTYARVSLMDRTGFHERIRMVGLVTLAGVLLGGLWLTRSWFGGNGTEKSARAALFFSGVFYAAGLLGLAHFWDDEWVPTYSEGIPYVELWLSLNLAGAVCVGLAVLMLGPVWVSGSGGILRRLRYTGTVAILGIFTWSMVYWNLVGPWNA